jgi:hypothetical protein
MHSKSEETENRGSQPATRARATQPVVLVFENRARLSVGPGHGLRIHPSTVHPPSLVKPTRGGVTVRSPRGYAKRQDVGRQEPPAQPL